MPVSAFQTHKFWLVRTTLLLVITCLVTAIAVWFSPRPLLWATLVPATLPLSILFFVAMPVLKQGQEKSQNTPSSRH